MSNKTNKVIMRYLCVVMLTGQRFKIIWNIFCEFVKNDFWSQFEYFFKLEYLIKVYFFVFFEFNCFWYSFKKLKIIFKHKRHIFVVCMGGRCQIANIETWHHSYKKYRHMFLTFVNFLSINLLFWQFFFP